MKRQKNTYLENFKSIDVQHADIDLLVIFHHGFVDGLKSKDWVDEINVYYRLSTIFFFFLRRCTELYKHAIVPRPGSQTLVNAGLWRGRHGCNMPAPRSESHRWTPPRFPTCCPSSGSSVSPLGASGRFQAETQERLGLLEDKREKALTNMSCWDTG